MGKSNVRDTTLKTAPATSTALMDLPQNSDKAPLSGTHSADSHPGLEPQATPTAPVRKRRSLPASVAAKRFPVAHHDELATNRQAELFYLQKQIQTQTQLVFVLEDGQRIQGIVEWYDRNSIKVRGKSRVLIYKSAIKYLFKAGENGHE